MSAVSGSSPGGQKRSLAELLATRPRKPDRKSEYSSERLQEAALYLLSRHQDVNQFLLEVGAHPCKKASYSENSTSNRSQKSTSLTGSFIGSTLRDQALHLGVPPNILGARAAVSSIQQICHSTMDNARGAVLSQDQRDRLTSLLKTLKGLLAENCFSQSIFLKEIWEQERPPVLEAVWHLQNMEIVALEDLLESCKDPCSAVDWFCSELRSLFRHMENPSVDLEFLEQMMSNLLVGLIGRAFCQSAISEKSSEHSKIIEISLSILDKMLSWLLDTISEAKNDQSYKPGVERHWLIAYKAVRYRARLIPESLEDFFIHTLSQTLTYKPKLKVSDAIRLQGSWSFVKTCLLLTDLYRKLFVLLSAEKLTSHIQRVLDTQEVNWHHVLTCVSCLVICQSEAQQLVKDLLSRLLSQAFESYELEYLITSFLISRQAALEGPAAFMSYTEWFKCTFGAASSYQSATKKSLVFLLKFLTDLVPYETPQYLKVHILHPPFVPTKFRPLLMEYISLAKTRLADMKVSIEDMGLYEDLSAGSDKDQTQTQAQQDVEKAVQIFENTGKIPASVMEASIFRRPYFTSRFLPALLAPRVLPKVPDSHMLLIDSLKRADKIPTTMLSAYLDACELEEHRKLEGNEKMDVSLNEEPMARLQSALWELRPFVTDAKRYDEVSSQLAVISDRLASVMGNSAEVLSVTSESLFSDTVEELEPQELTVADLLLTSFCQCVMAASSTNPPDRQGNWPTLYVKMLCGHHRALFAVLSRTLQLLYHQAPLLRDPHVVGLAAFAVHLHECRTSLASPSTVVLSLDKFWETLLNPRCSDSLSVVLRFCTAAVSYACCRFLLLSPGASHDSIPPLFMRKLQHLLPRLVLETRAEVMTEEEMDTPFVVRSLCLPSAGWKEAAVTLWRQSRLQQLLREQSFQLSFSDWLLWEMALNPDKDPLCDTERQEYQRWALNYGFLPESSAAGGCGGDLESACSVVADVVLQFCSKSELGCGSRQSHSHAGLADILCRLQELVCDLMMSHSHLDKDSGISFLFRVFHQRLEASSCNMETSTRLRRQGDLATCCRILLGLPAPFLISACSDRGSVTLSCGDFFKFINKELKNIGQRGYALPYNITAHFFRGVLGSSTQCEDPSDAVNSILIAARSLCPIILTSAALWWTQLDPAISCQWNHLFGGDLPKEIGTLRETRADVDSCLSQGTSLPLTDTVWLTAAFLHFTTWKKKFAHSRILELRGSFGKKAVPLLDSLLFFSILDLIPVILKGGAEQKGAMEKCLQTMHCLEERGGCWITPFQLTEEGHMRLLRQTASEEFLNLLPLAFFSLALCLPMESTSKQHNFLSVALEMYAKLVQLFLDGSALFDPMQMDTQEVFSSGRQFLFRCILKSPPPSTALRSRLPQPADPPKLQLNAAPSISDGEGDSDGGYGVQLQFLGVSWLGRRKEASAMAESWEEKDPELAAVLRNFLQPPHGDDDLYDEPDIFGALTPV